MLLAIHTTTAGCHVALDGDGGAPIVATAPQASTALPGLVAEILGRAGLALTAVEAIVVALGPGSFTGIKIGLATAWGLSRPAGLAVWGVGSLDALAAAGLAEAGVGSGSASVIAIAGGYGGLVYAARFLVGAAAADLELEGSYRVGKPDAVLADLGDAEAVVLEATPLGEVAAPALANRSARIFRVEPSPSLAVAAARVARARRMRGAPVDVRPLYLRADPAKAW